jgi:hypothetical protein
VPEIGPPSVRLEATKGSPQFDVVMEFIRPDDNPWIRATEGLPRDDVRAGWPGARFEVASGEMGGLRVPASVDITYGGARLMGSGPRPHGALRVTVIDANLRAVAGPFTIEMPDGRSTVPPLHYLAGGALAVVAAAAIGWVVLPRRQVSARRG